MTTQWQKILSHEEYGQVTDSFGESRNEYPGLNHKSTITPLTDRGIISVSGPDTDKLLQGQITCDVNNLKTGESAPGALCDVKGRMLSQFFVYRSNDNQLLLITHEGLVGSTLATLKKYAVFYKTQLADDSANFAIFGVNHAIGNTPPNTLSINIGGSRKLYLVNTFEAETLWINLKRQHQPVALPFWNYLSIIEGLGEVRPETTEEFIPQMLNLQHTGAVNFRKGCYTGQEIVARMQYLGKLKKRMYRLFVANTTVFTPGTSIDSSEKKNIGTVVVSQEVEKGQEMLAVLTHDALDSIQLVFNGQSAEFTVLPLPYDDKFTAVT